jgi:hypothetical protein
MDEIEIVHRKNGQVKGNAVDRVQARDIRSNLNALVVSR